MKLKFKSLLFIPIVLCLIGCDNGEIEHELSPTPTQVFEITVTPELTETPEPTRPLSFEEEKILREEERLALLVSPTPGPEPYDLLGAEKEVEVGDVVTIGEYCHNRNQETSFSDRFPIKWLVLEKEDDKVLLISLYNLDVVEFIDLDTVLQYEKKGIHKVWETSSVRQWLNEKWLHAIFDDGEFSCIIPTNVHTPDNPVYGTEGGANTMDYLFLLSIDEVQRYFSSDEARKTQIVPDVDMEQYDLMPGTHTLNTTDYYDWWLRSPGALEDYFASVGRFGDVNYEGEIAVSEEVSIRPAMWIDLNKVKEVGLELTGEE